MKVFTEDNPNPGQYNSTGWKTWHGYLNEAKQLSTCLLRNRHLTCHAVFSFDTNLTEEQHRTLWKKVVRKLKAKQLSGVWIREINKQDRIHYHLLFATEIVDKETLEAAVPSAYQSVARVHLQRVKDQFGMAKYFAKARVRGNGSRDKWFTKRRLFRQEIKLDKTGSFGNFWLKRKEDIWKNIIAQERQIARHTTEDIQEVAQQLHELIQGEIPLRRIERLLAIQTINGEKSEKNNPRNR